MKNTSVNCFLKTAEVMSITEASEELYMARQTVSRQIAILEQELGCALFFRTPSGLELTPEGQKYYLFFSYARDEYFRARKMVSERFETSLPKLRLGCVNGIDLQPTIMNLYTDYLNKTEGNVDLYWEYVDHEELYSCLMDGQYDMIIADYREEGAEKSIPGYPCKAFAIVQPMIAVHKKLYGAQLSEDFFENTVFCLSSEYAAEGLNLEKSYQKFWLCWSRINFQNIRIMPNRESVERMVRQESGFMITTNGNKILEDDDIMAIPFGPEIKLLAVWKEGNFTIEKQNFIEAPGNGASGL